jgi:phospholipid/cholesterol/gamma-HCH transport system ATP-binding protein
VSLEPNPEMQADPTQPPPEPIIQVHDLVTRYGQRKVLDGVNLTIYQGEIMVIMGGSGSGKSTLLRHMLGLKKPSSGSIRIMGQDVARIGTRALYELRKQIGVAFQGGALLSSLSVGENVSLPLREHTRLDGKTIEIMSRMKLEMMNLSGVEHLMPAELSGGMVKRAGLARAIIMDPKILFFDEPSAGLDPITSVELDELILLAKQAMNMTIVVVTHELESAFKIADRIAVLGRGQMVITGTKDEVRACQDERVQDMLNRRPRREVMDGDEYLHRLAGLGRS